MLRAPLTLPVDALARILRRENLGTPHVTIVQTPVYLDKDDLRAAEQQAVAEVVGRGLAGPRGLDPELRDSLALLARPAVEFYGWIRVGESMRGVLVGAVGRDAVLSVRDGDKVTLSSTGADSMAEALVAQLPPVPAGNGPVISVPQADVAGGRRTEESGGYLRSGQLQTNPAVDKLRALMAQPTTGGGELYVAVRDSAGRRLSTSKNPLSYVDTLSGRWINQIEDNRGEKWVRVAPATPQVLTGMLHQLRQSLTR